MKFLKITLAVLAIPAALTVYFMWWQPRAALIDSARQALTVSGLTQTKIHKVIHWQRENIWIEWMDYLRAGEFTASPLTVGDLENREGWYRGDQLPADVRRAVNFIDACRWEIPWFPPAGDFFTERAWIYPLKLIFNERTGRPRITHLFIARPADGQLFYFAEKN
ncbi:MAG: hypothetical protein LBK60_11765 [Verrucomicrobiales bacterium]|jgi:hypothetical protein|nr:hypothetical protein [Verrucomicrobiales bacterium]